MARVTKTTSPRHLKMTFKTAPLTQKQKFWPKLFTRCLQRTRHLMHFCHVRSAMCAQTMTRTLSRWYWIKLLQKNKLYSYSLRWSGRLPSAARILDRTGTVIKAPLYNPLHQNQYRLQLSKNNIFMASNCIQTVTLRSLWKLKLPPAI